jgi:hypothetical protein
MGLMGEKVTQPDATEWAIMILAANMGIYIPFLSDFRG